MQADRRTGACRPLEVRDSGPHAPEGFPAPGQLQVLDGGDNDACYNNHRHQHPDFEARDISFRILGEGVDLAVEALVVGPGFRGEGVDLAVEAFDVGLGFRGEGVDLAVEALVVGSGFRGKASLSRASDPKRPFAV